MATRPRVRVPKNAADGAEVVQSAYQELDDMLHSKFKLVLQLMGSILDEKQMLEQEVTDLKEKLNSSNLELQHYTQMHQKGIRVQTYEEQLQQSSQVEWHQKELEICRSKIQNYEVILNQIQLHLQQDVEAIKTKQMELQDWEKKLHDWEKKLQYREEELALHENAKSKDTEKLKQSSDENKKYTRRRSLSMSRIRSPARIQYGVIRSGSITHEGIHQNFKEYFTKYKRQYGSFLMKYKNQHATILTHIIQIAFDKSKDRILELIRQTIDRHKTDEVLKAVSLLRKSCLSTSFEAGTKEIEALFSKPIYTVDYTGSPEGWEERKYAYSILLNAILAIDHKEKVLDLLNKEVLQNALKIANKHPRADIDDMVKKAVHLSWNMVTLVPPAIVAQPTEYHIEWHEMRYGSWKEDASDRRLNYYCPVLFYSTLGHVAEKGEVGNILPANTEASGNKQVFKPSRSCGPRSPCVGGKLASESYGMQRYH